MSSTCEKVHIGEYNPTYRQGQTVSRPIQIAINGVPGYGAGDTFAGGISDALESDAYLVDYTIDKTDPVTGIITLKLTVAQTKDLPIGLLYHDIDWTRVSVSKTYSIGGRPNVKGRAKR
jgi:hypothetical protein